MIHFNYYEVMKNFTRRFAYYALLFFLVFLSVGASAKAQTTQGAAAGKSYYYPLISATINVNKDSTIDVTERQTLAFTGNFHAVERDISLKDISGATNISVADITTGEPLTESSGRLDVLDPASWGKFAVWKDTNSNAEDVEWYFNLENATHTWAVSYKVHGAIAFDQSYDRLYWNVFSDYTVPVERADVSVILPEAVPATAINETYYRTFPPTASGTVPSYASGTFAFSADAFAPYEAFTIDATWPKGIVSQQAFWWDLFSLYLPAIVMAGIILLCLLFLFLWWLFAIKLKERPGNIIPQYEPPDGLRPAIAEAVATEKVTSKSFAATIVDLAVRGWVRIDEDNEKTGLLANIMTVALPVIIAAVIGCVLLSFAVSAGSTGLLTIILLTIIFVAALVPAVMTIRRQRTKKDYRITLLKDFTNDAELKEYEKKYLSLIFSVGDGKSVSTKDFKMMGLRAREFYKDIMALRQEIGAEANIETNAFAVFHVKKTNASPVISYFLIFAVYIFSTTFELDWFWAALISAIGIAATVWIVVRMTRRTAQGKILHDEWLGFKMYLEVAEKYQLQNLTPDLFEKYLPYAMIFGIEKKWAKVFERASITVPAPHWYGGYAVVGAMNMVSTGAAFSATAFSTSFSSSFSSAIASSFGGGAGGGGGFGGGGAGGGGGGGGGGAR